MSKLLLFVFIGHVLAIVSCINYNRNSNKRVSIHHEVSEKIQRRNSFSFELGVKIQSRVLNQHVNVVFTDDLSQRFHVDLSGVVNMGDKNQMISSFLVVNEADGDKIVFTHYTVIYHSENAPYHRIGGTLYENVDHHMDLLQELLRNSCDYAVKQFSYSFPMNSSP